MFDWWERLLRLHAGPRRRAPALRAPAVAPVRGSAGEAARRPRPAAAPPGRGRPPTGRSSSATSRASACRSTRSPAPTWRTTAGRCAPGTPTAGCAPRGAASPRRTSTAARPDLWASDDPSAVLPRRDADRQRQPAGVRDRRLPGRTASRAATRTCGGSTTGCASAAGDALVAYLCHQDRVPLPWQPGQFATTPGDLSDLLLLDVEAGSARRRAGSRRRSPRPRRSSAGPDSASSRAGR